MKKLFLALLLGSATVSFSQDAEPCCTIIGINPGTNSVTARNNVSGQLFTFRAEPMDIQYLKLDDAVTTNESFTYVTAINKIRKQYFAGPVNLVQVKSPDATGLVSLDYENPCCRIISIDTAGTCCSLISAQNKTSGGTFQFIVPKELGASVKSGDAVYTGSFPSGSSYAVVQSMYLSNTGTMNAFVYPVEEAKTIGGGILINEKWIMSPVSVPEGNFGRLNTDYPADVQWGIDIYTYPARKLMMNRNPSAKQKYYELEPGNYDFKLNNVIVVNVPVEKGKETRLKAGYLSIGSVNSWSLADDANTTIIYSGSGQMKIALPVGSYQLKKDGQVIPVKVKDGELTEI